MTGLGDPTRVVTTSSRRKQQTRQRRFEIGASASRGRVAWTAGEGAPAMTSRSRPDRSSRQARQDCPRAARAIPRSPVESALSTYPEKNEGGRLRRATVSSLAGTCQRRAVYGLPTAWQRPSSSSGRCRTKRPRYAGAQAHLQPGAAPARGASGPKCPSAGVEQPGWPQQPTHLSGGEATLDLAALASDDEQRRRVRLRVDGVERPLSP